MWNSIKLAELNVLNISLVIKQTQLLEHEKVQVKRGFKSKSDFL